jgi:hypothetical protein
MSLAYSGSQTLRDSKYTRQQIVFGGEGQYLSRKSVRDSKRSEISNYEIARCDCICWPIGNPIHNAVMVLEAFSWAQLSFSFFATCAESCELGYDADKTIGYPSALWLD